MNFGEFKELIKNALPESSIMFQDSEFEDRYVADIDIPFPAVGDHEHCTSCSAEVSYDTFHGEFSIYLEVEGHRLTQEQAISAMRSLLNGVTPKIEASTVPTQEK